MQVWPGCREASPVCHYGWQGGWDQQRGHGCPTQLSSLAACPPPDRGLIQGRAQPTSSQRARGLAASSGMVALFSRGRGRAEGSGTFLQPCRDSTRGPGGGAAPVQVAWAPSLPSSRDTRDPVLDSRPHEPCSPHTTLGIISFKSSRRLEAQVASSEALAHHTKPGSSSGLG